MGTGSSSGNETVEKNGCHTGFEELISQYSGPVYRLCLNVSQSHSESERVLNDVFAEALESIADLSQEQMTVTRSLLRSAVARMAESEQSRAGAETAPATQSVDDLRGTISHVLASLPYEYRVVYSLREVLDLSVAETADVLGISELETRAYLHRARLEVFREVRRRKGDGASAAPAPAIQSGDELVN